jgi:energy-coupling factor transporter ATP-binding protein EcfA2
MSAAARVPLRQRNARGRLPPIAQYRMSVRYTGDVFVAGRRREMEQVGRLLDRAMNGTGGLIVFLGPSGSGKTTMVEAAAGAARRRGLDVLRASPRAPVQGRLAWVQMLRDAGAPDGLVAGLLADEAAPLDLDSAARHLVSGPPRLIVVDDVDRGGADALEMLSFVAARCAAAAAAVIATAAAPLGLGAELPLGGLSEADLGAVLDVTDPEAGHALWMASRGLPGVAQPLAEELADLGEDHDPVVHLALRAASSVSFLDVDANLIRLLETAVDRADGDVSRARVLAKLARELLGDASAATRRRELVDEALRLARRAADPRILAEVLDARLHALWDPAGAEDRLAAGSEIIDLARAAGDDQRERHGQFWRFVALMELARVAEAESALAAFDREAAAAGDVEAAVMVTARHAMLAILRGRFGQAAELIGEVADRARRAGMADADGLAGTLVGSVAAELGDDAPWEKAFGGTPAWSAAVRQGAAPGREIAVKYILAAASRQPGHLFEAPAARMLVSLGRDAEAGAELERLLPRALVSPGPGGWEPWPTWPSWPSRSATRGPPPSCTKPWSRTGGGWWCGRGPTAPGVRYRTTSGCWRPAWVRPRTRYGISRRPLSSNS